MSLDFVMPNKLRRSKACKNAGKDQAQNIQVTVLPSESSFDDAQFGNNVNTRNGSNTLSGSSEVQSKNRDELSKTSVKIEKGLLKVKEVDSSTCEAQISRSTLDTCLQEIQTSNPKFPVNQVFRTLQKKAGQKGQDLTSTEKRKHGEECFGNAQKRQRSTTSTTSVSSSDGVQDSLTRPVPPRPNRLSRTRRLKHGSGKIHEAADDDDDESERAKQTPKTSDGYRREPFSDDMLWTDKYSPQHSSEVIGNSSPMKQLHSWLKKWKLRTDERRKRKKRRDEELRNDFQDEMGSEDMTDAPLCNTILLTGPPGVGKTASVYACALELGFKVFEVNCSSLRSGREVLTQIKEATQSHLVEASGNHPLKPAFFTSYSTSLPVKNLTPQNLTFSKKRRMQNIFRSSSESSLSKKPNKVTDSGPSSDQKMSQNKKKAMSLILFEEVDVIFDDDVGFLAAIKTFMKTTKRPVILTTNDLLFRERFNTSLEEIIFKTPPLVDVCSLLQLVCLAENVRLDMDDVKTLFKVTGGDVRRCLLQLQLWANSGGGVPECHRRQHFEGRLDCYKDCSANMLGLRPVTPDRVLQFLKNTFWAEQQMTELLQLMVESWRNGVPLLYSNLDLLLQIKANGGPFLNLDQNECSASDSQMSLCETSSSQNSARSAKKTTSRLSRKRYVASPTAPSKKPIILSPNRTFQKVQQSTEKMVRTNCLGALAHFFDIMSFIDATVPGVCRDKFSWTGANIKDGLLDVMREEESKSYSGEMMLDLQATVEALGLHRCWRQVSEMWDKDTQLGGQSFSVLPKTKSLSLVFQSLCSSIVSQRRFELNKTVLSSRHFSLLHNTRAVCIDYMPVIRFTCRSRNKQKHHQKEKLYRCLKSLRAQLELSKLTTQLLAEEFSLK